MGLTLPPRAEFGGADDCPTTPPLVVGPVTISGGNAWSGGGTRWDDGMARARELALRALASEDVPVGAVVIDSAGRVLGEGWNQREATGDPTAHAEVVALRAAAGAVGRASLYCFDGRAAVGSSKATVPATEVSSLVVSTDALASRPLLNRPESHRPWDLSGTTLVVTLEPCAMCAGALVAARVDRLVFGAWDDKAGAAGSVWDLVRDSSLHRVETIGGVQATECAALLREFFEARRRM